MTFASLRRLLGSGDGDGGGTHAGRGVLPAADGYALWADSYPPWAHNTLMQVEQSVVLPMIAAAAPRRALDVGTGTGRYLPLLAAAGARLTVGLDLSRSMLAHNPQGRRVCGDACGLPFAAASFDLVCASLMAGDLPDLAPMVLEASRVLAPGGQFIYSDFHPSWTTRRWRRTFTDRSGRVHELARCPHSIDHHLAALAAAGFSVRTIREPRIDARVPVVAVFHAVKPRYQGRAAR